jgi:hypothetical protein
VTDRWGRIRLQRHIPRVTLPLIRAGTAGALAKRTTGCRTGYVPRTLQPLTNATQGSSRSGASRSVVKLGLEFRGNVGHESLMSPHIKVVLASLAGAAVIHAACASTKPATVAAQASTLDVATEACSNMMPTVPVDGGFGYVYAAHAYPGLTAAQLSQVRVIGHIAAGGTSPLGYVYGVPRDQEIKYDAMFVNDGSVAVICGTQTTPPSAPWYDTVTFTLVK